MKNLEWLKETLDVSIKKHKSFPNKTEWNEGYIMGLIDYKDLVDKLDEPEVLSQEWIDEHAQGGEDEYILIDDLEGKLVSKQELPVIPDYVAEYITDEQERGLSLKESLDSAGNCYYQLFGIVKKTADYLDKSHENFEKYVRAYLHGYTVEKEPLYRVRLKVITDEFIPSYLRTQSSDAEDRLKALEIGSKYIREDYRHLSEFTEDELKRLDIWDSEQWEVEELEE